MAESVQLVLCSPLCFLIKKYCQTQVKVLKSALLDFYDGDMLSNAKQQLLKDFSSITHRLELILFRIYHNAVMAIVERSAKSTICLRC